MGVQYLSDDYMTAATEALNADVGFVDAMANVELTLQFSVSEAPAGDVDYYLSIKDGTAQMALGKREDADATISSTYETAVALSKGDLNTQMAFMTGTIKVAGNMAVLMMNQNIINKWGTALQGIAVDY